MNGAAAVPPSIIKVPKIRSKAMMGSSHHFLLDRSMCQKSLNTLPSRDLAETRSNSLDVWSLIVVFLATTRTQIESRNPQIGATVTKSA